MVKLILYTGTLCPKCPKARDVVREAAKELGLIEGKDFVEKLIDGQNVAPGSVQELDGCRMHIVGSEDEISADKTPAVVGGEDLMIEALTHQIASTPAILIDDELAFVGDAPGKEELISALRGK
ncbi:MAG: hypothetical protein A7315_04225 [Candidatus Altiarchaeales archaeon WOR_SM1_79]|nr:MAG: hypothetical protein A7315_04225 [Candidatus Altiarchaeales archaeon WOR_SM1_79]